VVFHCLDHHLVLPGRLFHLHAARAADGRVRNVPVPADLVRCVHDDNPLLVREDACHLAQHGGLAHARPAEEQDALAGFDDIPHDVDSAKHRPADATSEADDFPVPVADSRYAVQSALYARAVVVPKGPDALDDVVEILLRHLALGEHVVTVDVTGFAGAPFVQNDLKERIQPSRPAKRLRDIGGHHVDEGSDIVGDLQ